MADESPASKSTTKKSAAKKSTRKTVKKTARKAPAKKTAKKAPAKKGSDDQSTTRSPASGTTSKQSASARAESRPRRDGGAGRDGQSGRRGAHVAESARELVLDLTGRTAESVTGLERTDDGWRVDVEVLELERIPSTTDVLATYEVTLDEDGELQGYRRVHRYLRGSPGDG